MNALVLSGGFFRGTVHIGAIKALEEEGFEPDIIIGTSMGSIIGGLYAYGYSCKEIEDELCKTKWSKMIDPDIKGILSSFIPFYNPPVTGVLKGKKIYKRLRKLLKNRKPEIPFIAMATDIVTGESVQLSGDNIAKKIRASMSMPGVFSAVDIEGRCLVDGGVNNNFPINIAILKGATKIVAVNAVDRIYDWHKKPTNIFDSLNRFIAIRGQEITTRQVFYADSKYKDNFTLIEPDLIPGDGTNPKLISSYIHQGYRETKEVVGGEK